MNHWMLDAIARTPAQRIALRDGVRSLSYADLISAVRQEMIWQQALTGQRVAMLAENSADWVITDLALLSRGALNVPLPAYFTAAQIAHALDDAHVDAVLSDDPLKVQRLGCNWRVRSYSPETGFALLIRDSRGAAPAPLQHTSKVTYTSGSTGEPKGVCLSADALSRVTKSLVGALGSLAVERHLCLLPLPTLLENVAGVYVPLALGATCEVPSGATTGMSYGELDVSRLLYTICKVQPQSLILVPELLRVLVNAVERGWTAPASLKFIAVGGAPIAAELLEQAAQMRLPVFEGYGLSECASVVCLNTPHANRRGSVGRPLQHAQVTVDSRGQLLIRGALMNGYTGASPSDDGVALATGDLGEIDADGYVYVRGRLKNMFISSFGRNVCPEWIETELMRDVRIRHAVVFGEGRAHPIAVLNPMNAQLADIELERAVALANRRLPDYARIHEWVRAQEPFDVRSGALTANGRVRRERIGQQYAGLLFSKHVEARAC